MTKMIEITGRQVKALMKVASTDASRVTLQHLHIGPGYIESCNDAALCRLPVGTDWDALISCAHLKGVGVSDRLRLTPDHAVIISKTGLETPVAYSENIGTYPNTDRVIPSTTTPTVGLKVSVLKNLIAIAEAHGEDKVNLQIDDPSKGIKVSGKGEEFGVIMPCNIT